jgi:hypothetical protein
MRKLWILLIVLMVVGLPMFAADTAIKGNFYWLGNLDLDGVDGASMVKARQKFDTKVDDFNQIYVEFRWDNGATDIWNPAGNRIKAFRLTTDVTGALGLDLPVTAKIEAGVWESDFMNYWYATRAGKYYVNSASLDQQQGNGAARLHVGAGPVTVYAYHNFAAANGLTAFGAEGAVGPVAFEASYWALPQTFGDGVVSVEAKFAQDVGPLALKVIPAFNYNLGGETWAYNVGVGATYDMFGLAVDVSGETDTAFRTIVPEVSVKPVEGLELWVALYMDLLDTKLSALQGVDIMASYKLGAAKFMLGYMVGGDDNTAIPVDAWATTVRNGLYLGIDCSF